MDEADDEIKFTVSQTTRASVKDIKAIMEEWAAVLDMLYHHLGDTIIPALPDNKDLKDTTEEAYYEITSMPIELFYVKKICDKLGVPTEEYIQYRDLVLRMEEQSKPRRRG